MGSETNPRLHLLNGPLWGARFVHMIKKLLIVLLHATALVCSMPVQQASQVPIQGLIQNAEAIQSFGTSLFLGSGLILERTDSREEV